MSKSKLPSGKKGRSTNPGFLNAKETAEHRATNAPPTVSLRWIGVALLIVILAAAACVWGTFCLTFWQGSWQLLYHPAAAVARTPASAGMAFDAIGFAATEAGIPQLQGWWIPAGADAHFTVLYCHGADGNLDNALPELARMHAAGLNLFAFDYRGYGRSQFIHPSERHWLEDAESALAYLAETRHIAARSVVVAGSGLGADLALEFAAAHPELAGIVVEDPLPQPTTAIFGDPRAHMVPARWLVDDRWDLDAAAAKLRVPALWFCRALACATDGKSDTPTAFQRTQSPKMIVWLTTPDREEKDEADALSRWIGSLEVGR
jgi:uncharacterized protein